MDNNIETNEKRFGFCRDKTTEELESILDKLIAEREEDYKIFEDTNNSSQKLDAHNDVKFEDEQIAYINKLLGERGKTR